MPHVFQWIYAIEKQPVVRNGTCVELIKAHAPGLQGLPTTRWREGKKVLGSTGIVAGTAIATFVNGRYPRHDTGNHAAFFLTYDDDGIWVVDRWSHPDRVTIEKRFIPNRKPRKDGTFASPSNSAGAFSVIEPN